MIPPKIHRRRWIYRVPIIPLLAVMIWWPRSTPTSTREPSIPTAAESVKSHDTAREFSVSGKVVSLSFSPDGRWLAVGTLNSPDGGCYLWDRRNPTTEPLRIDGDWIATGGEDEKVRVWTVEKFIADGIER